MCVFCLNFTAEWGVSLISKNITQNIFLKNQFSLLAFAANSAAQSSAQTHIHSAIVVIDTSNNAWHSQVHWLFGTPHLAVKASNDGATSSRRNIANYG